MTKTIEHAYQSLPPHYLPLGIDRSPIAS